MTAETLRLLREVRKELDQIGGYWTEHLDTLAQAVDAELARIDKQPRREQQTALDL